MIDLCDEHAQPHEPEADIICTECSLDASIEEYHEAVNLMCMIMNICQPRFMVKGGPIERDRENDLYAVCLGAVRSEKGIAMCHICTNYACGGTCHE